MIPVSGIVEVGIFFSDVMLFNTRDDGSRAWSMAFIAICYYVCVFVLRTKRLKIFRPNMVDCYYLMTPTPPLLL